MTKEDIGATLKQLRLASGMTQKEVAEKLGRKQQVVGHWETGYAQPDANTLFALCEIYGATVDEAFGFVRKNTTISPSEYSHIKKYRDLDDRGREHVDSILDWETDRVRMLNKHFAELAVQAEQIIELKKAETPTRIISYYQRLASAGSGEYLFDSVPTDTIEVPLNELSEEADFVIGVNGDSMEPTFCDGDRVYVKIVDEISTGQIGIFIKGSECFIKEVGDGRLKSHNHKYPDIYPNEEIRLVGSVLGKIVE